MENPWRYHWFMCIFFLNCCRMELVLCHHGEVFCGCLVLWQEEKWRGDYMFSLIIFIVSWMGMLVKRFSASSNTVMHLCVGGLHLKICIKSVVDLMLFSLSIYDCIMLLIDFCYIVCRSRDL